MSKLFDALMSDLSTSCQLKQQRLVTMGRKQTDRLHFKPPLFSSVIILIMGGAVRQEATVSAVNNAASAWVENITVMEVLIDIL